MKYTTGFVVGKFSPLHRGHQYLIERALAECEHVTIVSYSVPEFPNMPASVRLSWLNLFYSGRAEILVIPPGNIRLGEEWLTVPDNSAPAIDHRYFCARIIEQTRAGAPDVVFTSEEYGDDFSDYLSVYFSKPVDHVCVDISRKRFPVSGTQLRNNDVTAMNYYLSPAVKNPPVHRIVLYGGESSGKTTLAQALATELKTLWVPEEGRFYTERRGGVDKLVFEDMVAIARAQLSLEIEASVQAAAQGLDVIVCDTSPLTTYFYSLELFDDVDDNLINFADRVYDTTILCSPDFLFVQDGTRMDDAFRLKGYRWYQEQLRLRNITYTEVTGTVEQRTRQVIQAHAAQKSAKQPAGRLGPLPLTLPQHRRVW